MRNILIFLCASTVLGACNSSPESNIVVAPEASNSYGCCVPEILDTGWYTSGRKAPLFSGLQGINFKVSTRNEEAQKYFNQGLMLSFAFNHAEAGRSFFEAARQDSTCAMCWWGFAYVLGPNYNGGMEPNNFQRAYDAVVKASSLSYTCTQKEKILVEALTHRYSNDTTIARSVLDSSYAAAMRKVYVKYPDDVNIAALFAESLMDLHPWNLWNKDGTPQPWTPEIVEVLEKSLAQEPLHPGANHFYIHAQEMSQHPEASLASADLLRDLVPGAGHLVHMPAHTYIRTGRYHDGVVANQNAVQVDSLYMESCHSQGVYPLAYYPHNYHFIAACAALCGESRTAMMGAHATADHAHKKLMRDPFWSTLQHYYSIPWYIEVKMGLWNEVLASPQPEADLKYPTVVWNYARGMAMLAGNKLPDAKNHLAAMKEIMADTTLRELTIWGINSVYDLCLIASDVLEGEILAKEKKFPEAIELLSEAVRKEDALNYDEPPDWFFSVRHHLGAVLIDAGKYPEAIQVYEKDLANYRENGWALKGLMNAYEKTGDREKYNGVKSRFDAAWKHADIEIVASRIL